MKRIRNIKYLPILLGITLLGIVTFQVYWLMNTYEREKRTLEKASNFTFRETVHGLQASKLKLDRLFPDSLKNTRISISSDYLSGKVHGGPPVADHKMVGLVNVLKARIRDTANKATIIFDRKDAEKGKRFLHHRNRLIQFLYEVDSLQDSVKIKEIEVAFEQKQQQNNIRVPFVVTKYNKKEDDEPAFNEAIIGFSNPIAYRLQLQNTFPYLIRRISASIILSLFIIGFTTLSFVLLYRNLLRERRLADIKNEFISNITHELKTPIATVSVAIEALRSFSASVDPARTKEYLDISANELQRLSLLVDKVLKLSMFEKKEVDLKYELLDMKSLIDEVYSSMRLQFEKYGAQVTVQYDGDTSFEGDRLHMVSVVFNLLDNALKYSTGTPQIHITAAGTKDKVFLSVADNGLGISEEYQEKIFEKFFRVPTGNLHNAKGYGLGLSYVSHVVEKHKGNIRVESAQGEGSTFVVILPKRKLAHA